MSRWWEHTRLIKMLSGLLASSCLLACASSMVAPRKGITDQVCPRSRNGSLVELATYDFRRLGAGYGLYLFGFDFRGEGGSSIAGFSSDAKSGVRAWEYRFAEGEAELKQIREDIMFWGFPSISYLFLARRGYEIRSYHTFRKGRIVYGGRLFIDMAKRGKDLAKVENHFDEDFGDWLKANAASLGGVEIDTIAMSL